MAQTLRSGNYFTGDSNVIQKIRLADPDSYFLIVNGKIFDNVDELPLDVFFTLHCRLLGGKGGFGSLLRSFRIHKSANQLMCRDLSGRRLADVKEEERLRKYIAKREEREKKAKEKEEEKLLKLKSGSKVKHHFKDKKYMRQRDVLLEQTEDAIDAGMAAEKSASPEAVSNEGSSSISPVNDADSDSDIDIETGLPSIQKRKRKAIVVEEAVPVEIKKPKVVTLASAKVVHQKVKVLPPTTPEPPKVAEKKEKIDYSDVDLNAVENAMELEELGLDHLKHALETRGLKCGGTATERAARLFSVKGLSPDKYPKKVRAAPSKK